jgi:hypothetical protein
VGRGQRFAWDVQEMPVLALSPARGDRFAPLFGVELPGTSYANVAQLNSQIVAFIRSVLAAAGVDVRLVPDSESAADTKVMYDALNADPTWSKLGGTAGGYNAAVIAAHDRLKAAGKLGDFYYNEVNPFQAEWQAFHRDHSHTADYFTQLGTGSDVYQTWQARLDALRAKAAALHVKLPAEQTKIAKSTGIGDVAKMIGLGALGVGGAIALIEIAKR